MERLVPSDNPMGHLGLFLLCRQKHCNKSEDIVIRPEFLLCHRLHDNNRAGKEMYDFRLWG